MWTNLAMNLMRIMKDIGSVVPFLAMGSIAIGAVMMFFGKNNRESGKHTIINTFIGLGIWTAAESLVTWFIGVFIF